jgi:hypothetical protein
MLEIVGSEISLYRWSEVDIEYARASVVAGALRPLQVCRV